MTVKRKIEVVINGRDFTVVGDGEEEYIKSLAKYVDDKIHELTSKNDKLGQSMSAILAAFNIADELHISNKKLVELETESKEPIEKYDDITGKYEDAIKSLEELQAECDEYKSKFLKTKLASEDTDEEIEKFKKTIELKEHELLESQKLIRSLQDKVFENQIDLIETKKELSEVKKHLNNVPEKVKEEI